jgi:exodeoxyribonuclease VII small subunit
VSPTGAQPASDGASAPASAAQPDATLAALPFDQALAELQAVVGRLEQGGLPLEESISLYERGVALHEHCAGLLAGAELRVQRLVDAAGGGLRAVDLRPDDEDAS